MTIPAAPVPAPAPAAAPLPTPPVAAAPVLITIDEFKKVALKIGKVLECTEHANANKLLVLKVDLGGGEVRQIVSGIKTWYTPAQMIGKIVVVVANLQPAQLRGVESNGMLLATSSGDQVIIVSPEKDAAPGSKVS